MDFEKIMTWIGYGIALSAAFFKLRSDIRNVKTNSEKEKEIIQLKFQNIENEIKSQKEIVALQFQNKAEKVDMLIRFKDTISETIGKEFDDLKNQITKVDKSVSNIMNTLSLCDVRPKRREGDN